ncbi:MAG: hypothetical protein J0I41_10245 [Filimonas sp.]|nr:hypothetical protein [Filimonas sp.]
MIKQSFLLFFSLIMLSLCAKAQQVQQPYIQLLGTAQDAGYPQMGCTRNCCTSAWKTDSLRKYVASFALVDPATKKWWLFEATPDIKEQLHLFQQLTKNAFAFLPEGIFITHAHIGHYTGLMQLGREVMNAQAVPVYVLPKLKSFLETNGPWSQLVKLNNIALHTMQADSQVVINDHISVTAVTVPHRDEYSETAGFKIQAGAKKILFIPDIDKWQKWNSNIVQEVSRTDIALLDATFYDAQELPGRDISEIPHPLVTETMQLFNNSSAAIRNKIFFIHFNHTNPLLWDNNTQKKTLQQGFNIAQQGAKL